MVTINPDKPHAYAASPRPVKGLTEEEIEALVPGGCAVCGRPKRFSVHNLETGTPIVVHPDRTHVTAEERWRRYMEGTEDQ